MGKVDPLHPDLSIDPLGILRPASKLIHQLPLVNYHYIVVFNFDGRCLCLHCIQSLQNYIYVEIYISKVFLGKKRLFMNIGRLRKNEGEISTPGLSLWMLDFPNQFYKQDISLHWFGWHSKRTQYSLA